MDQFVFDSYCLQLFNLFVFDNSLIMPNYLMLQLSIWLNSIKYNWRYIIEAISIYVSYKPFLTDNIVVWPDLSYQFYQIHDNHYIQ